MTNIYATGGTRLKDSIYRGKSDILALAIGAWPSGKATVFGAVIRRFESYRPSQEKITPRGWFFLGYVMRKSAALYRPVLPTFTTYLFYA